MKYLPFFIFVFSTTLFAQDIYLKNDLIYRNVRIISEDSAQVIINYNTRERTIALSEIESIDRKPFKPFQPSRLENNSPNLNMEAGKSHLRLEWLTVSALGLLVAYDSFSELSEIETSIDSYRRSSYYQDIIEDLESKKSRKIIVGSVGLVVSIISFVIAFDPFYTKFESDKLTLSFRF